MPATQPRTPRRVRIGPEDHGRRMSLAQFDRADGREGWVYELAKGVIQVTNVPNVTHLAVCQEVRDGFVAYRLAHRGVIHTVAASNDAKVLVEDAGSERHPDISVYLTPPPIKTREVWSVWVPAIVVEIVSSQSAKRDYQDKPPEYFAFGVTEYWIVDPIKRTMVVLERWRGKWRRKQQLKADQKYTTMLLPGFVLDLKQVFAVIPPG